MFPEASSGTLAVRLAVALGIGLLVGLERERRKGERPGLSAAGIRTFALVALVGGLSAMLPGVVVFAVVAGFVSVMTAVSYARFRGTDAGMTSEVALLTTFLLGGLALREPALAAGIGVVVTVLLAARGAMHRFVRRVLTERELHDGLVLAAAALVILPLTPDRGFGPYAAFNPRLVWRMVVVVLAVSSVGYVAIRTLGARAGLPLAGFAGGFVSSTATIGSMASLARATPALGREAAAGAVLSTVATILQLAIVLSLVSLPTLQAMALPLGAAAVAALSYGALFAIVTGRRGDRPGAAAHPPAAGGAGLRLEGAFDLRVALVFALTVSVILLLTALVTAWVGSGGLLIAAGLAGFADAHAAATSAASLAAAGRIGPAEAAFATLLGLSTNTVSKVVVAVAGGTRRFALGTVPGLALVAAAAWIGWAVSRP